MAARQKNRRTHRQITIDLRWRFAEHGRCRLTFLSRFIKLADIYLS
ncbi:MAG: hypothetical protein ACRCUY_08495 [Thermoguttaceae bacterium]